MERLKEGFKLFQPCASEIVKGKLPYLVRAVPTNKRGRVAIIATSGIDGIWAMNAKNNQLEKIAKKVGIIGSIEIKNCIEIKLNKLNKIKDKLIKLGGEEYWQHYPKYLIPKNEKIGKVYIWILNKPRKWNKPIPVYGGGILWSKINLKEKNNL